MKHILGRLLSVAFAVPATAAQAQDTKYSDGAIRIGMLNDRSGPYADLSGERSTIGARMAAEEFGNRINGVLIEIVVADHQNETDIGVGIASKWYDVDGVDVITDVSNSAMSLALNGLVKEFTKLAFHNSASADQSRSRTKSRQGRRPATIAVAAPSRASKSAHTSTKRMEERCWE